jgi:hypothetical protein
MGDRANMGIRTSDGNTIYIYSHWGGYDRHEIMANSIAHAMVRDGDEGYFTRIFISRIIGRDWEQETGHGMSINKLSAMGDGYDLPIYDYKKKTIEVCEEVWDSAGGYAKYTDVEYNRDQYLAEYAVRGVGAYV